MNRTLLVVLGTFSSPLWIGCENPETGSPTDSSIYENSENNAASSPPPNSVFGDGTLDVEDAVRNNSLPRCGGSYQAAYIGNSNTVQQWVQQVDGAPVTYKAGSDTTSKATVSGNNVEANLTIETTINQIINEQVSEAAIRRSALKWDGPRQLVFYPPARRTELKAVSGWDKISCSLLPVVSQVFTYSVTGNDNVRKEYRRRFHYDPPLPTLIAPNALRDVYLEDLKSSVVFHSTATLIDYEILQDGQWRQVLGPDDNDWPVTSTEIEIQVEVTEIADNTLTLEVRNQLRDEQGNLLNDQSLRAEYEHAHFDTYGVFPTLIYRIDTKDRLTTNVGIKVPFENRSTDENFHYTNTIDFVRQ